MSSLLFLGLNVIVFFIVYGIAFTIVPMILGAFFSIDMAQFITDSGWLATYNESESVVRWIIPLIPTIGIFLAVMKIMMVAAAKGRD